jgi:hypothetical protein
LKNKYKLLSEEFASVKSKFDYISGNYDFTSNLKKINMEDMRVLTQTNSMVNDSISNFLTKIASFKKQNLQTMFDF